MAKVIELCKYCGRKASIKTETFLAPLNRYVWTYECGHTTFSDRSLEDINNETDFVSLDGSKSAYQYQKDGVRFLQSANGTALLADAMGLGKTIQVLLWLRANPETRALLVVKSATIYQWLRELASWCSADPVWHIASAKAFIPPGMRFYIISHDLLGTREKTDKKTGRPILEKDPMWQKLSRLGLNTIIVDECHAFKDSGASRTGGLIKFIREANPKYRILMSGTPILNRASEYYTALNIIAPQHFYNEARFQREWLVSSGGSLNQIASWKIEKFKALTSRWILRREKRDVLAHLPELQRTETYVEISDPRIKTLYNQQLDLMGNAMANGEKLNSMSMLGYLSKLRHITAQGKALEHGVPLVQEFLENTDESTKICVGVHHRSVADLFCEKLPEFNPIGLSGADSPSAKDQKVQDFATPGRRLMIANILAGGVGLNLQYCSNAIVLERQWNSSMERQFEDRFHRNGQTEKVVIDYLIARGTIDQFFADLIARKRAICKETIGDDSWNLETDEAMMSELVRETMANRL